MRILYLLNAKNCAKLAVIVPRSPRVHTGIGGEDERVGDAVGEHEMAVGERIHEIKK